MKLDVKLIRQPPKSMDCGITCIEMVLNYFNRNDLLEKLKKVKVKKHGIYTSEITKFFQNNGFNSEIIFFSTHMFTLKDENCSQDFVRGVFLRRFENYKGDRKWIRLFMETMDEGGVITIKRPTIEDIKNNITKNSLIIANVTTRFLRDEKPKTNLHYIVITGIDEKFVCVNDPGNNFGGKYKHKHEDFLYSLHSIAGKDITCGSLMVIKNEN